MSQYIMLCLVRRMSCLKCFTYTFIYETLSQILKSNTDKYVFIQATDVHDEMQ